VRYIGWNTDFPSFYLDVGKVEEAEPIIIEFLKTTDVLVVG